MHKNNSLVSKWFVVVCMGGVVCSRPPKGNCLGFLAISEDERHVEQRQGFPGESALTRTGHSQLTWLLTADA